MIVAETINGHFKVIDRVREMVRLAAGLDSDNILSAAAIARAVACLERFSERIRGFSADSVRVVGTNTLRKARNGREFQNRAESALGFPIDVISGREEARLIYLGVSHGLEDESDVRLVIDIGGGSTELILGHRFDPFITESLHMGCVGMSNQHFADGELTAERMDSAELHALQELEPIESIYRSHGWESVIGASGTAVAIRDIVVTNGWSKEGITASALAELRRVVVAAEHVDRLDISGLSAERRPVFPGGVAIMRGIFRALNVEQMRVSSSALREGLLYDLLGRIHHEDVREQTVEGMAARYGIDQAQGERVFATSKQMWQQVADIWDIGGGDSERLLRWASSLHEIGRSIAHSQYHKHGAYLLAHHDMPGFSRGEQRRLAVLVRGHRRKFPVSEFKSLPEAQRERVQQLCVLLRIAVVLHRRRSETPLPEIRVKIDGRKIRLRFPKTWLAEHQLTRADLEQEATYLKNATYKLRFK